MLMYYHCGPALAELLHLTPVVAYVFILEK